MRRHARLFIVLAIFLSGVMVVPFVAFPSERFEWESLDDAYEPSADLSVAKSDSPDPVAVGGTLTYVVTVANNGPDPATGVSVADTLPDSVTFVSSTASQGSCVGDSTVTCSLGNIPAGAGAEVSIDVIPDVAETIINFASVTANEPDPNEGNNTTDESTTVTTQVDLSVAKSSSPNPAAVGGMLTYMVYVANLSPDMATGVSVVDTLPDSVTFVSSASSQGSCSGDSTVTCSLGNIPPGAGAEVTIDVIPEETGTITNTASVTGIEPDPNPDNDTATEDTGVISGASTTIEPDQGGTLVYPDPDEPTITVEVPPNAVDEPITLVYTPSPSPTHYIPAGFSFAGHAFDLDVYQDGDLLPGSTFSPPIVVTLYYNDTDVAGIDEGSLTLDYWHVMGWVDAATTCAPPSTYDRHPDMNWLSVSICHLSEFALFGKARSRVYLPIVLKNR